MGLDSLVPFVYLVWLGVLRLGLNEVVHVHLLKYPLVKNTKTPISLIYHLFALKIELSLLVKIGFFVAPPPEDRLEDRSVLPRVIHCMFLFDFLH
ncbi:hypothetical protein Scep_030250 [Stephania cephalantha]|uniref:Uncharacterized protein n=1 Tax=Stephania cephalantha TaxID=152367 RepID=A0AAP0DZ80_9MAGN